MARVKIGSQVPTQSLILPYRKTLGEEAVDIYNLTGRTAAKCYTILPAENVRMYGQRNGLSLKREKLDEKE
ncbi:MAG: hypothetical protein RR626_02585 [Anaerovoracaceae bacterium]